MKRLVLLLLGLPAILSGQHTERPVYLSPEVRAYFNSVWDTTFAAQPERAYCLYVDEIITPRGDTAYLVDDAARALPYADSPEKIVFNCGHNPQIQIMHTHTPATCDRDTTRVGTSEEWASCAIGGDNSGMCMPSDIDRKTLVSRHDPFAMIQCGRDAFVTYYPPVKPDSSKASKK